MKKKAKELPDRIGIEASKYCNLRCAKCPTGLGMDTGIKGFLDINNFRKMLDEISDFSGTITLTSWGEAFLNPNIFDIIKEAKNRGIRVTTSSNLCHSDPEFARKVVESGIDKITIGIDGASEETYLKYRRGGNWNLVMENISKINEYKKRMNCSKPELVWQIILNCYNENEIEQANKMAKERGMSFKLKPIREENIESISPVSIKPSQEALEKYFPQFEEKHREEGGINRCNEVWSRISIDWNGDVYPCCIIAKNENKIGNVFEDGFMNVWNSENYSEIRKIISDKSYIPSKDFICYRCLNKK